MEEEIILLEEKLKLIKKLVDEAYDTTKNKYNENWANTAITNCFLYSKSNNFTRDNNARTNINSLLNRPNEIYQILLEYAISSYLLNNMECDISSEELQAYATDFEGKLDYSGKKAIKIAAIATATNTYWTYNMLAVNKKLKLELVLNFVTERYIQNKRQELDSTNKVRLIKINTKDKQKQLLMSKTKLNIDVRNMNNDDDIEEYIPPTKK